MSDHVERLVLLALTLSPHLERLPIVGDHLVDAPEVEAWAIEVATLADVADDELALAGLRARLWLHAYRQAQTAQRAACVERAVDYDELVRRRRAAVLPFLAALADLRSELPPTTATGEPIERTPSHERELAQALNRRFVERWAGLDEVVRDEWRQREAELRDEAIASGDQSALVVAVRATVHALPTPLDLGRLPWMVPVAPTRTEPLPAPDPSRVRRSGSEDRAEDERETLQISTGSVSTDDVVIRFGDRVRIVLDEDGVPRARWRE